jgi:hypothetical protein
MCLMRRNIRAALLLSLLAAIAGCQQKSESSAQSAPAESSSKQPVGKVEKAVANAVGAGGPAAAASSGPPADGILDPVRAEAELPLGQPPKLTMGSNGAEPRVALRSTKATVPRGLKIEVSLQAGMDQGLPPIEMTLGLDTKPMASSAQKSDDDKPSGKMLSVVARVRDVRTTIPNVPREFASQIAGLKGGKVSFSIARDGGGFGYVSELAAGAKSELRDLLESVSEALSLLALPIPSEPVGNGAFWMVVSRDKAAGFGLVGYHMVKLTRADDKTAEIEVDTRRYAIGRIVDPALLPPGSENVTLRELSAGGKGHIRLGVESMLPISVEANTMLRGTLDSGEGAPKQAVQSATNYRIALMR